MFTFTYDEYYTDKDAIKKIISMQKMSVYKAVELKKGEMRCSNSSSPCQDAPNAVGNEKGGLVRLYDK